MGNNINEFFSAFSSDQRFFLNLPVLWSVNIGGVSSGAINTVLNSAGEKWSARISPDEMTRSGNILVAQNVSLPNEASNFTSLESGSTMGGFLPGYGLNARSNFLERRVSVSFLETQMDLEHNFFRPWMIALGIKGLIAQGTNLRGDMTVRQYTNGGNLVKGFKFNKIFPIDVEGFTLNYENSDFPIKMVTFGCENYEQL